MERRSAVRTAVVWDALQTGLSARHTAVGAQRPLQVVDVGGGTGGFAVRVAELGHQVTVVDPSPDALAALERRAAEVGATAAVRGVLGDADSLADIIEPSSADAVVCHGVLEVVDRPADALVAVAQVLAEGGLLSVLAAQRSGAVFSRALAGHLGEARALLGDRSGDGSGAADLAGPSGRTDATGRRFTGDELSSLLAGADLAVTETRGIRIFTDHISSSLVDSEPGAVDELRALELAASTHPDFIAMATQLHLLATRG